jgi:hypothetical protein
MTDWWNRNITNRLPMLFKVAFDHNRWRMFLFVIPMLGIIGCELMGGPRVRDPLAPEGSKAPLVTQDQLQASVNVWLIDYKLRQDALVAEGEKMKERVGPAFASLEKQRNFMRGVYESIVQTIGGSAAGTPLAVLFGLGGILFGTSATLDSRRKDAVIYTQTPQPDAASVATLIPAEGATSQEKAARPIA